MIKVMVAGRRKAGMTRGQMHQHALKEHAELGQTRPGFWRNCHRSVQNHVIAQVDFETGLMMPIGTSEYDVLSEFWFDSMDVALKAWGVEDYFRTPQRDGKNITDPRHEYLMMFMNEHVIGG